MPRANQTHERDKHYAENEADIETPFPDEITQADKKARSGRPSFQGYLSVNVPRLICESHGLPSGGGLLLTPPAPQ